MSIAYTKEQVDSIHLWDIVRHAKSGNHYLIIGLAMDAETMHFNVVYVPLYESAYPLFTKELGQFLKPYIDSDKKQHVRYEKVAYIARAEEVQSRFEEVVQHAKWWFKK